MIILKKGALTQEKREWVNDMEREEWNGEMIIIMMEIGKMINIMARESYKSGTKNVREAGKMENDMVE